MFIQRDFSPLHSFIFIHKNLNDIVRRKHLKIIITIS